MVYPVTVVSFAVGILVFIMIKIVPEFVKIFKDFETELPAMTKLLITHFAHRGAATGICCC